MVNKTALFSLLLNALRSWADTPQTLGMFFTLRLFVDTIGTGKENIIIYVHIATIFKSDPHNLVAYNYGLGKNKSFSLIQWKKLWQ